MFRKKRRTAELFFCEKKYPAVRVVCFRARGRNVARTTAIVVRVSSPARTVDPHQAVNVIEEPQTANSAVCGTRDLFPGTEMNVGEMRTDTSVPLCGGGGIDPDLIGTPPLGCSGGRSLRRRAATL